MISAFKRIRSEFGPVIVLVYNADARCVNGRSLIDTTTEEFENFTKINLFGAFWSSRFVLPDILASGKGTILFASATVASERAVSRYQHLGRASFCRWSYQRPGITLGMPTPVRCATNRFVAHLALRHSTWRKEIRCHNV
jgi:NAD(P)-dependent dehydrogenase (short-subunit alcohol dehydrogenase family)